MVPSPVSPIPEARWATPVHQSKDAKNIITVNDNQTTMEKVLKGLAEFGGTGILVFLGCLGCSPLFSKNGESAPQQQIALTFGLAAMAAIQIVGHISGGHINPAVTVAAATLGQISLVQVPIYFLGQMLGGIAGYGMVVAVTPSNFTTGLCSPTFNSNITSVQAVFAEFFLTLVLVWVCCGIWDQRNSRNTDSIPLRLGLTIAVLAMGGAHYSGANMNPARSFGPALINNNWDYHWVYWVGPLSAGFVGGIVYRIVFNKDTSNNEPEVTELKVSQDKSNIT